MHTRIFHESTANSLYSSTGYLASTGNKWKCWGKKRSPVAVCLRLPRPYQWQRAGGREWRPVMALWAARRWPLSLALHDRLRHYLPSARFLFMCSGTFFQSVCMCSMCSQREASMIEAPFLIRSSWDSFLIWHMTWVKKTTIQQD